MEHELFEIENTIEKWHELIRTYMNEYKVSSEPIKLTDKNSYSQMLIDIAKQSNQILDVAAAANILLEANIGNDRKSILHNIYNALYRLRNHFERIEQGKYRFTNNIIKNQNGNVPQNRRKTSQNRKRVKSGVMQAVKLLKEENPLMTLQEIITRLINGGFDFKGKKPIQSVTMAWVALGYAKDGKQQKMLIPPTSSPT